MNKWSYLGSHTQHLDVCEFFGQVTQLDGWGHCTPAAPRFERFKGYLSSCAPCFQFVAYNLFTPFPFACPFLLTGGTAFSLLLVDHVLIHRTIFAGSCWSCTLTCCVSCSSPQAIRLPQNWGHTETGVRFWENMWSATRCVCQTVGTWYLDSHKIMQK